MKKFIFIFIFFILSTTPAAAAESGWRYWGYFQAAPHSSTWVTANTGPTIPLKDGSVEGWNFTFSSDSIQMTSPRLKPRFSAICKNVKKRDYLMRIALVIDFGLKSLAPKGEKVPTTITRCVEIFQRANGLDVLDKNYQVRQSEQGFICGINRYPAKECSAKIPVPASLKKK